MSDHPARGTKVPSLMRRPEECPRCKHYHLESEACPVAIRCYTCGGPAGLYWPDTGNSHRECHHCFRERVDG